MSMHGKSWKWWSTWLAIIDLSNVSVGIHENWVCGLAIFSEGLVSLVCQMILEFSSYTKLKSYGLIFFYVIFFDALNRVLIDRVTIERLNPIMRGVEIRNFTQIRQKILWYNSRIPALAINELLSTSRRWSSHFSTFNFCMFNLVTCNNLSFRLVRKHLKIRGRKNNVNGFRPAWGVDRFVLGKLFMFRAYCYICISDFLLCEYSSFSSSQELSLQFGIW